MVNMKWKRGLAAFCCLVMIVGTGCSKQSKDSDASNQEVNKQEASNQDITVVTTEYGKVQGGVSDDVVAFKGIPFAKPPVGELRFAPPEKPEVWDEVLECKELKSIPSQTRGQGVTGDEDCLYLNVWTPQTALEKKSEEKLPVLVFIHGGAFAVGAAADPMYDGTAFAEDDVICVTIEYRLNMPGFLTSELLEEEYGYLGNLGLLDQIESLKWVKDNIENFGGDSNNITISGESAGAMSVSALTISPLAEGLFQKAIMESGSVFTQSIVDPKCGGDKERSIARSNDLMESLGAADIESLRKLNINMMVEKSAFSMDMTNQNPLCLMPVYDGKVIPEDPYASIEKGDFSDVAVLTGYNTDEGTTFIPEGISEQTYAAFVQDIFGEQAEAVLTRFPVDDAHSATDRARALVKMSFQMGCQIYGDTLTKLGKDVYVYNYDYHIPEYDAAGMGAKHGLELPFVFDTFTEDTELPEDGDEMIEQIHDYWVSFVKTGNPNSKENESAEWPKYNTSEKNILRLNSEFETIPLEDQEEIQFYIDLLFKK